jgi:hypothetical protein
MELFQIALLKDVFIEKRQAWILCWVFNTMVEVCWTGGWDGWLLTFRMTRD